MRETLAVRAEEVGVVWETVGLHAVDEVDELLVPCNARTVLFLVAAAGVAGACTGGAIGWGIDLEEAVGEPGTA